MGAAKLNLDHANIERLYRAPHRRGLGLQNRNEGLRGLVSVLSRHASPIVQKAKAHPMSARHIRDIGSWNKTLARDVRFLIPRPAPTTRDPADHLDPPASLSFNVKRRGPQARTPIKTLAVHPPPDQNIDWGNIAPKILPRYVGSSCRIRSEWGPQIHAGYRSVTSTGRLQGMTQLQAIRALVDGTFAVA